MSWSINLSGPPKAVAKEVADALLLLDGALTMVQRSNEDNVNVSLGGYVSWNEDEEINGSNVSFSFGESKKVPSS